MSIIIECLLLLQLFPSPSEVQLSRFSDRSIKKIEKIHHSIATLQSQNKNFDIHVESVQVTPNKTNVKVSIICNRKKYFIVIIEDLEL